MAPGTRHPAPGTGTDTDTDTDTDTGEPWTSLIRLPMMKASVCQQRR